MPVSYELESKWEAWKRLGVLASEMEAAALFTVSAARGIKTGCVLHALWNQERKKLGYSDDDANSSIRFSFSHDNTKEEIEYVAKIFKQIISQLKITKNERKEND